MKLNILVLYYISLRSVPVLFFGHLAPDGLFSSRFKTTLLLAFVILRFQVFMTTSIKMVGCLLECCSETDRRFRGADNLLHQGDEYSSETSVNLYSTARRYIS